MVDVLVFLRFSLFFYFVESEVGPRLTFDQSKCWILDSTVGAPKGAR